MSRRRLLWQIYPSYLLLILVSLALVTGLSVRRARRLHRAQLERELGSQALFFEHALRDADGGLLPYDRMAALCNELGSQLPVRLTAILADGRVIGDSDEDPGLMDNHLRRPEIQAALAGTPVAVMRHSVTVGQVMLYAVRPVTAHGETVLFARVAMPFTDIAAATRDILRQLAGAALPVIALAALTGLYVSRRLTRPLELMRRGAERFSEGDLSYRLPVAGSDEVATLSESMNRMAGELDRRLNELFRERNTREAVFDSMTEGLLAVDGERRIVHVNRAAATLFKLNGGDHRGVSVEQTIRNAGLQRLLAEALESDEPVEGEVRTVGAPDVRLLVRGTALRDRAGRRIGALVVLQDVTRVRRLEQMRQDFVANVSHELKTPITSIKGFVETLLDGSAEDPAACRRFLGIIDRQVRHLEAIVADLLLLSEVEHQDRQQSIALDRLPLRTVLESALDVCRAEAERKSVTLQIDCATALTARLSPHLFEQAVVNLLDNAIKHGGEDSVVTVSAGVRADEIVVAVRDTGCGIEQKYLERIFERFYRVDKGRSRQLGGTGLGLSLVKHIALVHGGRVSAESRVGEGSVFRIHLPAADGAGEREIG